MTRRKFIIATALLSGAILWSCNRDKRGELLPINPSSMPHEGSIHQKTWIAFNADPTMWDAAQIDEIKQNIILIVTAIAQYEPVSIMVRNADHKEFLTLLGHLDAHHYPIEVLRSEMDTLWMRDEGPTFVSDEKGHKSGINFNFRGVEEDQEEDQKDTLSSKMTDFIITKSGAKIIHSNLILNGGCFEVDGHGTAIMTESCIINDDYNPYWNKEEIETELKLLLGLQKIIWLKGMEDEEITNAQTDFYARFVKEGVVLVHRTNDKESDAYELTRENIKILQAETQRRRGAEQGRISCWPGQQTWHRFPSERTESRPGNRIERKQNKNTPGLPTIECDWSKQGTAVISDRSQSVFPVKSHHQSREVLSHEDYFLPSSKKATQPLPSIREG